jgi:hypothetical protein
LELVEESVLELQSGKGWVETLFALVVEEEIRVTFAALKNSTPTLPSLCCFLRNHLKVRSVLIEMAFSKKAW